MRNGWALPCSTTVMLVALASIALKCDVGSIKMQVPRPLPHPKEKFEPIFVPQNGRCFVSCVYLALEATARDIVEWKGYLRTGTSMPIDPKTGQVDQKRLQHEENAARLYCLFKQCLDSSVYIYIYIYIYLIIHKTESRPHTHTYSTYRWHIECICV